MKRYVFYTRAMAKGGGRNALDSIRDDEFASKTSAVCKTEFVKFCEGARKPQFAMKRGASEKCSFSNAFQTLVEDELSIEILAELKDIVLQCPDAGGQYHRPVAASAAEG